MVAIAEMPEVQEQIYDLQVQLNAVRKAVCARCLSVRQINKLTDRVCCLCQRIEKIQPIVGAAFSSADLLQQSFQLAETLEDKRTRVWQRDRKLLKKIHLIDFEVEKLRDEILFLTMEEAVEKLSLLYDEVKGMQEQREHSPRVEKAIFYVLKHIADIDFCLKFPISLELLEDSYQENFAQKMNDLADLFHEGSNTALLEFLLLSDFQKQEIYRQFALKKGASFKEGKTLFHSPEATSQERAAALEAYLKELTEVCRLAKMFLYQDASKALFLYENMPVEAKTRIEQLIWQRSGKNAESFFQTEFYSFREAFAEILMNYTEEKILGQE